MNDSKTSNDSGKSKHKKKVSFSIFEISTFEELAKLRKMREEELDDFVSNKKNTNQYLTNLNQRNKILSMSNNELISFDNNDKNIPNYNNSIIKNYNNNQIRNISNKVNIPRPLKKDESSGNDSYFYNQENIGDALKNKMSLTKNKKKIVFSSDEEDIKSNDIFSSPPQYNSIEKNDIIHDIDNIHSPINKNKDMLTKENIFSPSSNDYNLNTNNNLQNINNNIMFSENNENQDNNYNNYNEIEDNKNEEENDNKENSNELVTFNKNKIENINININNNLDEDKIDNNENNIENNLEDNKEYDNNLENNIENKNKEDDNKNEIDNNNYNKEINEENANNKKLEENATILFNLLEKIFQISPLYKINLIQEFFNNLFNFLEHQYDQYIDYELNDSKYFEEVKNKSRLIHQNIYYNIFINNVKEKIEKNKLYQEHKLKANKFVQYKNYKYKIKAFNSLLTFSIKQKEWIKSIQIGLRKKMIWNCMDSLKLYANYKKIKNYLRIRKKKKIFDALKNNKQLSIQLLKNGRKLSLIFEYRHFFNNCRKKILAQKGKEINNKLVNEFRYQYLLKGIFNLIKKNHDMRKEKQNLYNNMMINRNNRGKEFINIKVTRKETVKYSNGSTQMRIQNKINIV